MTPTRTIRRLKYLDYVNCTCGTSRIRIGRYTQQLARMSSRHVSDTIVCSHEGYSPVPFPCYLKEEMHDHWISSVLPEQVWASARHMGLAYLLAFGTKGYHRCSAHTCTLDFELKNCVYRIHSSVQV